MCKLYSITTNQAAISALFRVVNQYVGNLAPNTWRLSRLQSADGRELATPRWGMPSSSKTLMDATKKRAEKLQAKGKTVDSKALISMEPDSGTTNVRKVESKHWRRWLGPQHRCVVPFNSFSESNKAEGGDFWFALDESRPLACFGGIWANWTSVRKVKEGETTNDLYAFLTTEPNTEVRAIHPKAMPVILTTPEEVETWMTAPWDEAKSLQRPSCGRRAANRGTRGERGSNCCMKHTEARPYADPEAAARKLLELVAGVQPINDRIHIEKINGPFLSKAGCNASGPEFGAGIRYAIEHGWLELHESGTYVRLLPPGADLFPRQ